MMKTHLLISTAALACTLVACGGGSEVAVLEPVREVPASAWASPAAYTQYVANAATDDNGEPLPFALEQAPPASETDEPT